MPRSRNFVSNSVHTSFGLGMGSTRRKRGSAAKHSSTVPKYSAWSVANSILPPVSRRFQSASRKSEQPVRMVPLLRPGIREEHVHPPRSVRRQQIMENVKRLQPDDLHVVEARAPDLVREKPDASEHPFDPEEGAVPVCRGARGQERSFA